MPKNTSILLGDYFDNFITEQVRSGRYASSSEVIREALRVFEKEQAWKDRIFEALEEGEESGFIENFDFDEFLNEMHKERSVRK